MSPEIPKRTILPEAGEEQMLAQNPTEGSFLEAGFEVSLPPAQLSRLIEQNQMGILDEGIEDVDTSQRITSMQLIRHKVEDILSTLSEKELKTTQLRFGLLDGKNRSVKEAAEEMGVSESTIRRKEKSAIKKLREPERSQSIRDYLGQ